MDGLCVWPRSVQMPTREHLPLKEALNNQPVTNQTSIYEDVSSIPGLAQWVKGSGIAVSCCVGCRRSLDPELLWLWCRPAAAALIRALAWELSFAMGVALKSIKKKKDSM